MAGVFHWVKIRSFCYATEDENKLRRIMTDISGTEDIGIEMSDGHHGNSMAILTADIKGDRKCRELFGRLGKDVIGHILRDIDSMIDDDCTFRMRLCKQAAVSERYEIVRHGDVVSITCKIASHPARKDIAEKNMIVFLESLL